MATHVPRIACPRCGYDQSGAIASWREWCPLEGTCSECGAALNWGALFNPMLGKNPRFVEHCRVRSIVGSALRTWVWTVWPPAFWRRVRPEMPTVKWRWAAWLIIIVLTPRLVVGTIEAAADGIGLNRGPAPSRRPGSEVAGAFLNGLVGPGVSVGMEPLDGTCYPGWAPVAGTTGGPPVRAGIPIRMNIRWGLRLAYPLSQWWERGEYPPGLVAALAFSAAMTGAMALVWWRWGGQEVRGTRFLRAAVFSLAWLPALGWLDVASAWQRLLGALSRGPVPTGATPPPPGAIDLWDSSPDVMYRESTLVHWCEHSAGMYVLLVAALWTSVWWWSAVRAAIPGRTPVLPIVATGCAAAAAVVAVTLSDYGGLMQYWFW